MVNFEWVCCHPQKTEVDPRKRRFPSSFSEGFPCLLFFWWVVVDIFYIKLLCGGFKHFLFSPLPGEIIQFDYKYNIIQTGWFSRQLEKDIYREKPPEVALDFDMAGSSDGILVQNVPKREPLGPMGSPWGWECFGPWKLGRIATGMSQQPTSESIL